MKSTFLSMGAGVQTTALEILIYQGRIGADEIVFSDTGYRENQKKLKAKGADTP